MVRCLPSIDLKPTSSGVWFVVLFRLLFILLLLFHKALLAVLCPLDVTVVLI